MTLFTHCCFPFLSLSTVLSLTLYCGYDFCFYVLFLSWRCYFHVLQEPSVFLYIFFIFYFTKFLASVFVMILPASHFSKSTNDILNFDSHAVMLDAVRIIAKVLLFVQVWQALFSTICGSMVLEIKRKVARIWCKTGRDSYLLKMPGFLFLLGWVVLV